MPLLSGGVFARAFVYLLLIAILITAFAPIKEGAAEPAPVPDVRTKIVELQTLLNKDEIRQQLENKAQQDAPTRKSIADLFTALNKLRADAIVEDRFVGLLKEMTSLIEASRSNRVVLTDAMNSKNTPASAARKAFGDAWVKITERPKIHVITSWYGDLRTEWREGRLCTATSAMRKQCEQQESCSLPELSGKPYDQEKLCGFDPAPLADPAYKGVAVEFVCVRGSTETWDTVAQHPGIDPATGQPWRTEEKNVQTVRSSSMQLRCPYPVQ